MEKSFRVWIRVTWVVVVLSLLAILVMMVLSRESIDWQSRWWFLLFSAPTLLFGAILLPILYYYRKKYLKASRELLEGKYFVHWQYEPDEWNRFVESEWKKTKRKALWLPVGIVAGVTVLGYLFKGWGVDEFRLILPWIFGVAVLASLILFSVGQRTYSRGLEKVGEVFIGERAVQFNDTFFTWDAFGISLGKVQVQKGDPSTLQFEVKQVGRYGTRSSEVRVPIPRKREKEAEDIVQRLSR